MKKKWCVSLTMVTLVLDLLTKRWSITHLSLNQSKPFLDHLIYFTLLHNNRGAFSLFPLPIGLFIVVTLATLIGIVIYAVRSNLSIFYQIIVGLILGGGIGNLLDRIRYGYVIDFIDLRWWPVFNVADSAVTVAITLLVVSALWRKKPGVSHFIV